MNKLYTDGKSIRTRNRISIVIDNVRIYNPSEETLLNNGWSIYEPPKQEEPEISQDELYKQRIVELVRERYSIDDEIAILRQRESKVEEFNEYNAFVESVKVIAHNEIYGEEVL